MEDSLVLPKKLNRMTLGPATPHLGIYVCPSLSHVRLYAAPWTVALQAPLSIEFSRQEYWSGSRGSSQPGSPALQAGSFTI